MKKIFLIVVTFLLISCHKQEVSSGDLCFKLVNLMPSEGFSNQRAIEIEKMLDSIESNKIKTNQKLDVKNLIESLEKLRKYKLLRSPNIQLKFNDDDIKKIYLSTKEYEKIKKYTLDYLTKNNSKLKVELKLKELEKDIFYSDNIISFNEVKGETYFEK